MTPAAPTEAVASDVSDAVHRLPRPVHVLFSAPAPDPDATTLRDEQAEAIAGAAGLLPWPDWAVVRHGAGTGPHLLNVVDDLGRTRRAAAVVVCHLAPVDASLLAHTAAVAAHHGLQIAIVGHEEVQG